MLKINLEEKILNNRRAVRAKLQKEQSDLDADERTFEEVKALVEKLDI